MSLEKYKRPSLKDKIIAKAEAAAKLALETAKKAEKPKKVVTLKVKKSTK